MPAHRERLSSVNYGGPALVTNGDYLTIRANPLENTLVLWKFEKGKRSSVTWIRNTPDAHPSLFFPAMLHTDSIITAAGLPRMSFQAGLLDVAAYFAIVRLLGPCSVGAVYKKHQQDGKGSHDDLLSCCDFLVRNPRTLARLFRCFHELLRAFSIVLRSATLNRSQLREKVQRLFAWLPPVPTAATLSKVGNIRQQASHLGGSMRAFIAAIQATRKRMRSHLLTGALLALVTIVPTITPLTAQPADNSAYGRRLYHDKAQCSFCHGWAADGSGEPQSNGGAANLRQSFLNRDQLVEVISCGRPGTPMPHYDELAYTDKRCYGVTETELGPQAPSLPPSTTLQKREMEAIADYLVAKVIGRGPVTREECEEMFGKDARSCGEYPTKQ